MDDFNIIFSRAVYKQMRKDTGCPPVIAVKLSPAHWGWYVEMKDGSFSIDSVDDVSDVWEAKCKCIDGWKSNPQRNARGVRARMLSERTQDEK